MKELPSDFPHEPPENYSYEVEDYRSNMVAIWLRHHYPYSYSSDPVRTIWGFYNIKKRQYLSPINSKKVGNVVLIDNTTPYTSMPIKQNPLMQCFI